MSVRFANGNADTSKLKTGVSEHTKEIQTKNLGELFREAKKRNKQSNQKKKECFPTGIQYLSLVYNRHYKQGFQWRYYYTGKNNHKKTLSRVDLLELKNEVLARNLEWKVYDEEKAKETAKKANIDYSQLV